MRVLHVNAGNLYGGIEKILVTLAQVEKHHRGVEQHFALNFKGRLSAELESLGAPVHELAPVRVSRPWTLHAGRRRLAHLLRSIRFDVAVCHSSWPHAVSAPVIRRHNVPLVFWLHSATNGKHWASRWASRTPPDLTIAVSHAVAESAVSIFPRTRTAVIYAPMPYQGVPLSLHERQAVRADLGAAEGEVVIVQVGRMDPMKGHDLHLDALARLKDLPGWVCWMVGGPQRPSELAYVDSLKASVTKLGLGDRVRFLGERSDVPTLLASADIFCQPNKWSEGLSIAWMEAFQARLPIVTMNLGSAPEFVGQSGGILVPIGDVDALASALRSLVCRAELREQLGTNGYRRVRELCDPQRQLSRLHEEFAGVVRERPLPSTSSP